MYSLFREEYSTYVKDVCVHYSPTFLGVFSTPEKVADACEKDIEKSNNAYTLDDYFTEVIKLDKIREV